MSLPNQRHKVQYLRELSTSYLYRDVLEMANLRYPDKLRKLLSLLALQIRCAAFPKSAASADFVAG